MKILLTLVLALLLSSCAGTQLTPEMLKSLDLPETTRIVADNFTLRQLSLHKMHEKAMEEYGTMYASSGATIKMSIQEVNGVVYVLPEVSYRDRPQIVNLPMVTDTHAIWNFGRDVMKFTFAGFAVDKITGVIGAGYNAAQGATYNGPVVNSGNTIGRDSGNTTGEYILGTKSTDSYNTYEETTNTSIPY